MTRTLRRPRFLLPLLGTLGVFALVGVVASHASISADSQGLAAHRTGRSASDKADRGRRFGHGEAITRYLALDSTQSAKVADLVEQMRTDMSPLRESHRSLRLQLKAELDAPQPDAQRIGQLMIQVRSGRGALKSALEQFDQQLSTLLTEDQLARYQEWKQAHPRLLSGERGRREGRRERKGRPAPGPDGNDRPL
ncbi:MAG: hypothetical protein ABJC13_05785 [Acidobacteriota bacterium]